MLWGAWTVGGEEGGVEGGEVEDGVFGGRVGGDWGQLWEEEERIGGDYPGNEEYDIIWEYVEK